MLNYKEHLVSPSQSEKYSIFCDSTHKKINPNSDDIEFADNESEITNQELLISNITAAYSKRDADLLYKCINHLTSYLIGTEPKIFPLLISSNILPILIDLAIPEKNFNYRNTAFVCLYNITALFSETTPILLNIGIMDIFYERFNTEFNTKSKLSIDGIVNILIDQPQLIDRVMLDVPVSRIIQNPPFDNIISLFLREDDSVFYSINRLFVIYLENKIPQEDIDSMINFYYTCIENRDEKATLFSGLNGLNNLLLAVDIRENHYKLLAKVPFIEMASQFNIEYESARNEEKKNLYLNLISFCFGIQSKLFKYSFELIDYEYRQILECIYNDDGPYHFNDIAGTAAFELIDTILTNCEQQTYYSFLFCEKVDFLDVLYDAITKGPYYIVYPASESLIKIIKGCDDENDRFVNEKIFEALLKSIFIDNKKIQKETIEAICIIFARCANSSYSTVVDCITAFDSNDGVNIFDGFMNSTDNDELFQSCKWLLSKFFPQE